MRSAKCLLKMTSLIALRLSFHCPFVSGLPLPPLPPPAASAAAAAATTPAIGVGGCRCPLWVELEVEAAAAAAAAAVDGLNGLLGSRRRDRTATSGTITCRWWGWGGIGIYRHLSDTEARVGNEHKRHGRVQGTLTGRLAVR